MDFTRRAFCGCAASFVMVAAAPGGHGLSGAPPADSPNYPLRTNGVATFKSICGTKLGSTKSQVRFVAEPLPPVIGSTLSSVAKVFAIRPQVGMIDDASGAIMQVGRVSGVRDGILTFNRTFIDEVLSNGSFAPELLSGIFAHEFAHILQIRRDCFLRFGGPETSELGTGPCSTMLYPSNDKYFGELHADFMAGWALGRMGVLTTQNFGGFAKRVFVDGDDQLRQPDHHGTPRERLNAMASGYEFARTGKVSSYIARVLMEKARIRAPTGSVELAFAAGQGFVAGRKIWRPGS